MWEEEQPQRQKPESGLQLNKSRNHLPGGNQHSCWMLDAVWMAKQLNGSFHMDLAILWYLLLGGGSLKMLRSCASYVTGRILPVLSSAVDNVHSHSGNWKTLSLPWLLGAFPPLEHYLCSCKSINLLWCHAETKTTHLPIEDGWSSSCGETVCPTDAVSTPRNDRHISQIRHRNPQRCYR